MEIFRFRIRFRKEIFDKFRKNKNKDKDDIKNINMEVNKEKKDILTREEFEKIKDLLEAFSMSSILTIYSSYEDYLNSNNLKKEEILREVKKLCNLFEFNFNGKIPSKEDFVPYIFEKFKKENIELSTFKSIDKYVAESSMTKYFFIEAGQIEIKLEEEKRKQQLKERDEAFRKFDNVIRNVTEDDRRRAADPMARVKEIKRREKTIDAVNKMHKVINGTSNEMLSNEELTLLYNAGYLTEEYMECLYTLNYDLSFLGNEKTEGRSK